MSVFKHKLLAVMQHLVIIRQGKVLLLQYSAYRGKGVEGLWGLPGGHYISGNPLQDLFREVWEETGLRLDVPVKLLRTYVVTFPDGIDRFGVFYLHNMRAPVSPEIKLSSEHNAFAWVTRSELKDKPFIGPYHKSVVEDVLKSINPGL